MSTKLNKTYMLKRDLLKSEMSRHFVLRSKSSSGSPASQGLVLHFANEKVIRLWLLSDWHYFM